MTRINRWTFLALVITFLAVGVVIGSAGLGADDDPEAKKPVEKPKPITRIQLPSDKPENKKVQDILEKTKVSIAFNKQPIMVALDFLQTYGNINLVLDRTKLEDPDTTITLKLTNVSLRAALKLVTQQIGLRYVVRDGIVFISDEEGVRQPPVTVVYDVKDLLTVREGVPVANAQDQSVREALEELTWIVTGSIEPGTWDAGTGNAVKGAANSGLLVVTHTPDTQKKVQELLASLREARGIISIRTHREMKAELAELLNTYTDKHPHVLKLKAALRASNELLRNAVKASRKEEGRLKAAKEAREAAERHPLHE